MAKVAEYVFNNSLEATDTSLPSLIAVGAGSWGTAPAGVFGSSPNRSVYRFSQGGSNTGLYLEAGTIIPRDRFSIEIIFGLVTYQDFEKLLIFKIELRILVFTFTTENLMFIRLLQDPQPSQTINGVEH